MCILASILGHAPSLRPFFGLLGSRRWGGQWVTKVNAWVSLGGLQHWPEHWMPMLGHPQAFYVPNPLPTSAAPIGRHPNFHLVFAEWNPDLTHWNGFDNYFDAHVHASEVNAFNQRSRSSGLCGCICYVFLAWRSRINSRVHNDVIRLGFSPDEKMGSLVQLCHDDFVDNAQHRVNCISCAAFWRSTYAYS
jgi:hypothetical protein